MLWLALRHPDLPLEAATAISGAVAVSEGPERRPRIAAASQTAVRRGIRPGQAVSAATALYPALRIVPRAPAAETAILRMLALWAQQFTSRVALQSPDGLLLEIGGSLALFGGPEALCRRLEAAQAALDYRQQWAVAPTPLVAWWCARLQPQRLITDSRGLRETLWELPVAVLTEDESVRARLAGLGVMRVADVLRLPRRECARRLGSALVATLDRARGRRPDPRPLFEPPRHFAASLPLPAPVANAEALLFAARRLIQALGGYLAARQAGVQGLTLGLIHEARSATPLRVGLMRPTRDPEHLLMLLRTRLEASELPAPVTAIQLTADPAVTLAPVQHALPTGEGREGTALPEAAAGTALLDRLRTRLGEKAVTGFRQVADHRPEYAQLPGLPESAGPGDLDRGPQPLWLLPKPAPLETSRDGWVQGLVKLSSGPERIEGGWWDGADVARDYFVAEATDGARLWVYRDRRSGRWYLHGLFG